MGRFRLQIPRLGIFGEAEYDTREKWSYPAGMSYLLTEKLSASALLMFLSIVINKSLVYRTFASYVLQPFGGRPGWWWIPALEVALKQASWFAGERRPAPWGEDPIDTGRRSVILMA